MGVWEAQVADATQDVFMVVYRRLPDADLRFPIRTWLFAIARRIAANYRRKLIRGRRFHPLDEQLPDEAPDPAELAERLDGERLMAKLLEALDEDQRALVVLAEIEQLTMPEIAAITGIAPNTLYSRLRRARQQLCRALAARDQASAR